MGKENPYTELARKAIRLYLESKEITSLLNDLPKKMLKKKAGAFVSIHKKDGSLRGCIGIFMPTKKNIAEEIIANAIAAATRDPRFPPVKLEELPGLEISVDILSEPKLVAKNTPGVGERILPEWKEKLDPKKYGLIVSTKDGRRGLLLPDIPGIETPEEQIAICRRKAGISPDEPINLETFTVERHNSHSD